MPNLYQFTLSLFADRNIPPDKRNPILSKWIYSLLAPVQTLQKFMNYFINGYTGVGDYNGGTVYSVGAFVFYEQKIYYKWKYSAGSGILPTDPLYWKLVMNGKIGMDNIKNYSASKLVLETILNDYFETSGIYIENATLGDSFFQVYDGTAGTAIYAGGIINASTGVFSNASLFESANYSFIIKVPAITFALTTVDEIKAVISPFVYTGISFTAESL